MPTFTPRQRTKLNRLRDAVHREAIRDLLIQLGNDLRLLDHRGGDPLPGAARVQRTANQLLPDLAARIHAAPAEWVVIEALHRGVLTRKDVGPQLLAKLNALIAEGVRPVTSTDAIPSTTLRAAGADDRAWLRGRLPTAPWSGPHSACRVNVHLEHCEPPIWRKLVVPHDLPLDQFHLVLQVVMGWQECHLYDFLANRQRWDDFDDDGNSTGALAKVTVREFFDAGDGSGLYTYDFGDNWRHVLHRVEVFEDDGQRPPMRCEGGGRACPPEDVGGLPGLERALALRAGKIRLGDADPAREAQERLEWLGDWDPAAFDVAPVNRALALG